MAVYLVDMAFDNLSGKLVLTVLSCKLVFDCLSCRLVYLVNLF